MKFSPSLTFITSLVVFVGICNAADFSKEVATKFGDCVGNYIKTLWGLDGYTPTDTAEDSLTVYQAGCGGTTDNIVLSPNTRSILIATLVYFPWSDNTTLVEGTTGTMCKCVRDNCGDNFGGDKLPGRSQFLSNFKNAKPNVAGGVAEAEFKTICP